MTELSVNTTNSVLDNFYDELLSVITDYTQKRGLGKVVEGVEIKVVFTPTYAFDAGKETEEIIHITSSLWSTDGTEN